MLPTFIRAIRKDVRYVEGLRGYANAKDGEPVVLTYGFMTRLPDEPRVAPFIEANATFETHNPDERSVVARMLKAYSAAVGVTFVGSSRQDADIMFGQHAMDDPVHGYAGTIVYDLEADAHRPTDVWLRWNDYILTPHGRTIVLHEIGHALGLRHPFEGPTRLKGKELASSVMADDYDGPPGRPGIFDLAALQSIYGPARKRTGGDAYKVVADKLIWDGGGIDTMSAAGAKAGARIDLNDGSWSHVGRKARSLLDEGQSWLGHFTRIEKAVGSSHADTIVGNELPNTIRGGNGNDVLTGNGGADTLLGGAGRDSFVFKSYAHMGSLARHDRILDFRPGDKIDLRALDATFLGNGSDDAVLQAGKAGQYFNTATRELRFDANGDGVTDRAIGVAGVTAMKVGDFLL